MKIFIPFTTQDTGGTSTFAKKFKKSLKKKGHEVFFTPQKDYDILFIIVQCPFKYILHAKLHQKKIIHRLDGVFYWSVSGWKYPLLNLKAKIIHLFLSDHTIYQSHYSKYCADKFLGKKRKKRYTLIYNGVDTNIFSPIGEKIKNIRNNKNQKIFITASQFRREDQIIPIIKALKIYKKKYTSNFKFLIIGDFSKKLQHIPKKYAEFTQLNFLGKITNTALPKYERSADIFLMTHLNPPCPNNILEAMACGLPVCGVADGAMEELTHPGKNSLLIKATGNAFWKKRTYATSNFANNILILTENLPSYSSTSRRIAKKRFTLTTMTDKYIETFKRSI